jgi:signal transduction histidine kinase
MSESKPIEWIDLLEGVAGPVAGQEVLAVWSRFLAERFGLEGCRLVHAGAASFPETGGAEDALVFESQDGDWSVRAPRPERWNTASPEDQAVMRRITAVVAARLSLGPARGNAGGLPPEDEQVLWREQRLVAIGALAAEMAHEIRNPLTVMSMLFQNLGLQYAPDDPRLRDIQVIQQKMSDLNGIVERMLDLSRAQAPKFQPQTMEDLVEDVLQLVRLKAAESGVQIQRIFAKGLPPAEVDSGLVRQAILNLVMNALDAMPRGGELTVRIGLRAAGPKGSEAISVSVEDNGKGLTDEDYQTLFKPFLSGRKGGFGLGLSIVQKVADLHRGGVEVEGEESQGACFRLLFPLRQESALPGH